MRHQIGLGTTNVSVNLLFEERRVLGQIAAKQDQSMSSFIRNLISAAIRQTSPEAAKVISAARRMRRERMFERFAQQLSLDLGAPA